MPFFDFFLSALKMFLLKLKTVQTSNQTSNQQATRSNSLFRSVVVFLFLNGPNSRKVSTFGHVFCIFSFTASLRVSFQNFVKKIYFFEFSYLWTLVWSWRTYAEKPTFFSPSQLHLISKMELCILSSSVSFCFEHSGGNDLFLTKSLSHQFNNIW